MDLRKRKRQIALLLIAILIPVAVLMVLTVRVVRQEAELADKRVADQRRDALDQLRRELSARLQAVKLQEVNRLIGESGPGLPPDSPILFVAPLEQDRMILPWETSLLPEKMSPQFAESQAKGEVLEFRTGDALGAASAYKEAFVAASGPTERCEARLWIGRALWKANLPEEAAMGDLAMLKECDDVVDEDYVPFGLYAAERLVTGHRHIEGVRDYVLRLAATGDPRPPTQAYLLRSLMNTPAIDAGSMSAKLSAEIHEMEQLQALANDIHDQLGRIKLGFRTAPGDFAWIGYGDEPWLVTVMSPTPFAVPMVMAVSSGRIKPDGVALFAGETEASVPLGEGFVDVHVEWPAARFIPPPSTPISLYGMGLALIFVVTLLAAYLLLRDVHREVELAETRSHFVASVSHELKTPLTAIRMFAETLHMGRSPDKQQTAEYLQTIVNESQRLSRLVDNVLDFSRIEKGHKTYRMQPTCLADVVRSAARTMEYPLSELGFTLKISIDGTIPPMRADADALEQAILNLLTNAMKYSGDAREIELLLKGAENEACIKVVDHGIGIAPGDQAHIFEKFYRVRSAETDHVAGTGLGLTIAQHVVEAHGGRLEVSSAIGRGSVFSVRIPFGEPCMTKVLIVEDDPAILRGLADNLKFEKYGVLTASDAETAYRLQRAENPDLIILDLMLPRMSGLELCRKLRAEGIHVPILMLTARSEEADRVLGLDLGADDYVTKPFSVRELLARIRALLRRRHPPSPLPDTLRFADVEIDFPRYVARRCGETVDMTRKEFAILRLLVSRAGEVVTRDELLNEVWGFESYPVTRTVDNHIAGLRAKLESNPARPEHIRTVHGVGYKFVHREIS